MEQKIVRNVEKNINKIWDLVVLFFQTKLSFLNIYQKYEHDVLKHAAERGVDRRDLRLSQEEVSKLIDFSQLVQLRNVYLTPLKELSHELFRRADSTDPFDRWVNSIFHEISILKEEHYRVKKIAAEYEVVNEDEEFSLILDEVHEAFPRIIHHVYQLFQKTTHRLEMILPKFNRTKVLVRSVFLFGEELLRPHYENGLESFYYKMYPEGGPFEGYTVAAKSFLDSGFFAEAKEAIEKAASCKSILNNESLNNEPWFQEISAEFTKIYHYCKQHSMSGGEVHPS
ncbi:MAG: hypothetical protein D6785_11400 [Planctomycetota bacterium]|nr:MAG: hypothetical protein D6785_11400 [Planctomycetota bacterium]